MAGQAGMLQRTLEVVRFGFVGISSSLVYMAVIAILSLYFGWNNTPAVIVAYIVGAIVSYIGSGLFAFRAAMTGATLAKFSVVVGLSFIANIIVSEALTAFGATAITIGVTNVFLVGLFNYLLHKYWTFR